MNRRGAVDIDNKDFVSFPVENLPLNTVDWDAAMYPEEISNEFWPHARFTKRRIREKLIDDVISGDISYFLEAENWINPFASLYEMYKAMILGSDPEDYVQHTNMIKDLFNYSRAIYVQYDGGEVFVPDWRNIRPLNYTLQDRQDDKDLEDDGFIYMKSIISPRSSVVDAADVIIFENGLASGGRYEASRFGSDIRPDFSKQIGEYGTVGASWAFVRHDVNGKSIVEDSIDVAVEIAQTEQIIKHIIQEYSIPIFTLDANYSDLERMFDKFGLSYKKEEGLNSTNLSTLARFARFNKVALGGDGVDNARYVQLTGDLGAQFAKLKKLDERWTMKTGQVMMESGDASELAAGVALARRQAQLTIRAKDMYRSMNRSYRIVTGSSFGKFIDELNPQGGENAGTDNTSSRVSESATGQEV